MAALEGLDDDHVPAAARAWRVPALVLFDTVTKQPIPIGYGVMAADEVMQRIFYLTQVEPGSDY